MDYAVIMAGGTGKRLWPLSRRKRPKQVLKLFAGQTLLGACFDRLLPTFKPQNILVLTNAVYVDTVRETLPLLPAENVVAEPMMRDTSGAIGLAAAILLARDPEANMAVVTADQIIEPAEDLQRVIQDALTVVKHHPESLVTFGIKPTFASTQYGYIQCQAGQLIKGCANPIRSVDRFVEKPNAQTAQQYVDDGNFFWNSGMFVWKAATIMNSLNAFLPETVEPLAKIQAGWSTPDRDAILAEWFAKLPKISIDFAVMEKARNVKAIELDCRWLDMGSFNALADIIAPDAANNVVAAQTSAIMDSQNNIMITEQDGHMIATIGVHNLIIAHSPDATLVCPIDQADQLKVLLEKIEQQGQQDYL